MTTIWKWELDTTDEQEIEAPDNAHVLCIQMQRDVPCLWMLVDPNTPVRTYGIRTFGTGQPDINIHDDTWTYAGTYQLYQGRFVGHVFVA